MTYVKTSERTRLTSPASVYAPPASVVCDFGWYNTSTSHIFGNLIYDVAGNTYPPTGENPYWEDWTVIIGEEVTFDCYDSLSLGLPKLIIPTGVSIVEYSWDLGNGQTAQGPVAVTSYAQATPDGAATLTITDSLNRRVSTTHRLNFVSLIPVFGGQNESIS